MEAPTVPSVLKNSNDVSELLFVVLHRLRKVLIAGIIDAQN